jgi:hypothetical protein
MISRVQYHGTRSRHIKIGALALMMLVDSGTDMSYAQISRPAAVLVVTIPSESSVAVALPFDPFNSEFYKSLSEELGEDAYVLVWNTLNQEYVSPTNTATSSAGDAFWVVNGGSYNKQITLSGLVSLEHKTITVIPRLTLVGNPTVAVITNETISVAGDEILDPRSPESTADIMPIGQGMWYSRSQSSSAVIEIESPFSAWPDQENAPGIISVTENATGSIHIVVAAEPGTETILYGQDVPLDGALQPDGWIFIADGIIGENNIAQFEENKPIQAGVGNYLRCYLATVSGTDLSSLFNNSLNQAIGEEGIDSGLLTISSDGGDSLGGNGYTLGDDGHSNGQSTNEFSVMTRVRSRVIYVSNAIGNDHFTGEKKTRIGNDGPKKSVAAGLVEVQANDMLVVLDGTYAENVRIGPDNGVVHIKGVVRIKEPPQAEKAPVVMVITNNLGQSTNGDPHE